VFLHLFLHLFLILAAGSVQAAGEMAILKNTVVTRFNAADNALMKKAVDQALVAELDGAVFNWNNEKTRASGQVTALARYEAAGLACRKLRIRNEFGKRMDQADYKFSFL
jgi:surface antigen